jgi:6-pyruvoyltetrahydropterin/6-carboxytetrahydropterin synthase
LEVTKIFKFEASHILNKHPGKCSRLHGHSWVLEVSVEGPVNPETGFVMDFGDISQAVDRIILELDHRHLGVWNSDLREVVGSEAWAVPGLSRSFYPTCENLLIWIGHKLLTSAYPLDWSRLSLRETCTSVAILTRADYCFIKAIAKR